MTKFCKKCNSETERYASGRCKPCGLAEGSVYRAKYPDRVKETKASSYKKHAEKAKEYAAKWKANNGDRAKAYAAAWRAANNNKISSYSLKNKEKLRSRAKQWGAKNKVKKDEANRISYLSNKTLRKAQMSAWRKSNKELTRLHSHNYKAKKRENGGNLSKDILSKLLKLQRGKCPCCGEPLGDDYHLDHIMPIALGGSNTDGNIQLLRAKCNRNKSAKHPIYFMQSKGFLL